VANSKSNTLVLRIISAAVLIPPVLGAVYFGFPYFNVLMGLAVMIVAWEWSRLSGGDRLGFDGALLAVLLAGTVALASLGYFPVAISFVGCIAAVFFCISAYKRLRARENIHSPDIESKAQPRRSMLLALGALYIGLPVMALIWLRDVGEMGMETTFWLLALVWAADSGAYATGRIIGGPKLAPAISPNKTWAGLAGCVLSAAIVGAVTANILGFASMANLTLASAVIGAVSQGGDLVESWIKRRQKVKDTGALIPGHGGLLDRVDALMAAAVAAALIGSTGQGSILLWQ